jgi:hypothetical protein
MAKSARSKSYQFYLYNEGPGKLKSVNNTKQLEYGEEGD